MFGFLRRLLMAGDIKGVLDGSRRALRELSPALGERGVPVPADEFVMRETAARGAMGNLTPEDAWDARYLERNEPFTSESPFGGRVTILPDGRRIRQAPSMYSPIVAPYEGGRAWPRGEFGEPISYGAPPPWMGRGMPPRTIQRFDSFAATDSPLPSYEPAPDYYFADPARNFGGYGSPLYGDNVPRAFWRPRETFPGEYDAVGNPLRARGNPFNPPADPYYDPMGYPMPGTFADEYSGLRNEVADWRRRGLIN